MKILIILRNNLENQYVVNASLRKYSFKEEDATRFDPKSAEEMRGRVAALLVHLRDRGIVIIRDAKEY